MEGIPDIHLSLKRYQDTTHGGVAEDITVKVGEANPNTFTRHGSHGYSVTEKLLAAAYIAGAISMRDHLSFDGGFERAIETIEALQNRSGSEHEFTL